MTIVYANLDISTSEATGAIDDPFGYDQFRTDLNETAYGDDVTYKIEGSHTYTDKILSNNIFVLSNKGDYSITLESKGSTPAIIKGNHSSSNATLLSFFQSNTLNLKRLIFQLTVPGGDNGEGIVLAIGGGTNNIENCFFISDSTEAMSSGGAIKCIAMISETGTLSIKGSTFITNLNGVDIGTGNTHAISWVSEFPATMYFDVNSCYFEGNTKYIFYTTGIEDIGNIVGSYKYNDFHNNSTLTSIVGGNTTFSDGGNNTDNNDVLVSQLVGLDDVSSMTLPDDYYPIEGSNLLGTGDASLGLLTDLLGADRVYDSQPDIGAVELVAAEEPIVNISPSSKSFGDLRVGAQLTQTFTVSNSGTGSLSVTGISVDSPFSVANDLTTGVALSGDTTGTFVVKFRPTQQVAYSDNVVILSNDPNTPSLNVAVTGTGTLPEKALRGREGHGRFQVVEKVAPNDRQIKS